MAADESKNPSLDEIWADDLFDRRSDAEFLERFLTRRYDELVARNDERAFVLNIDAEWGAGKSFFMDRFRQQLKASGHLVVFVDAWRNDFAEDPLIAVMAEIDKELASLADPANHIKQVWTAVRSAGAEVAKQVAKGAAIRALGLVLTEAGATAVTQTISESVAKATEGDVKNFADIAAQTAFEAKKSASNEDPISDYRNLQDLMESFRQKLTSLVEAVEKDGRRPPLFIFIDEIDRCRPPFAIAMLERIKHIFSVPGVIFVVATATGQLRHSIGAVYGVEFDGARYLARFFDRTFSFAPPSPAEFVHYLLSKFPLPTEKLAAPLHLSIEKFLTVFFEYSKLDIRSIRAIYDQIGNISSAWDYSIPVELTILVPIIAANYRSPSFFQTPPPHDFTKILSFTDNWQVSVKREHDGRMNIPMSELMKSIWSTSHGNLKEFLRSNTEGLDERQEWMCDLFEREVQARDNGRLPRRSIGSIIMEYPVIVRQAGRMSQIKKE